MILLLQGGYLGVSLAAENLTEESISLELDCSLSTNVISHR